MDAGGAARRAQVLAGKTARQKLAFRQFLDPGDIAKIGHVGEAPGQHGAGHGVVLDHDLHAMPCHLQSEFEAANPRKQAHNLHCRIPLCPYGKILTRPIRLGAIRTA